MINFNKKDAVADAVKSILSQEETINDRTKDDIGGRKKTNQKDDVGPAADGKSTKVKLKSEEVVSEGEKAEKILSKSKPPGVEKTEGPEPRDSTDVNAGKQNKKLGMKEESEQLDEKNWIAGAIKKPGAMTAAAKREGESTSEYIKKHEHDSGKAGKRARLAKTLKSFKEDYADNSVIDQMINEVLSKDASAGAWIHDFVHSDNPKFAGKSTAKRKEMALAAYYAKQKNEEVESVEEESIEEALKGNQDKIDKNHNGKIDAQDFKILRGKKKANEETVEEGVGEKIKTGLKSFLNKVGGGSDEDQRKRLQKNMGVPQTGKPSMAKQNEETALDEAEWNKQDAVKRLKDMHKREKDAEKADKKMMQDRKQTKNEEVESVEEGWDDMVKSAKDSVKSGPKPNGGSGVKQGTRYGGGKQKEEPKEKVEEGKQPLDNVPFDPPYNTTSSPANVKDKSGAVHTPMSRVKHLARQAMKKVKTEMLGKAPGN
jgi:hypothetical protein